MWRFAGKVSACRKRAGTLRWARGGEGCSDSPLPTSGLHPPRNGKGATRPFQTPKMKSDRKKSSRFAQRFFLGPPSVPPQSLRDSSPRGASAAAAVSRYDPSRENSVWSAPQSATNAKLKIILPLNMPRVQQRRPPPMAETGRSCWGSGQQDARAAQGTMRMLGAATR